MINGVVNLLTKLLAVGKKIAPLILAYKAGKDATLKERYKKSAETKQRQMRVANKPSKSMDELVKRMRSGDL